jgi:hypothetical protein
MESLEKGKLDYMLGDSVQRCMISFISTDLGEIFCHDWAWSIVVNFLLVAIKLQITNLLHSDIITPTDCTRITYKERKCPSLNHPLKYILVWACNWLKTPTFESNILHLQDILDCTDTGIISDDIKQPFLGYFG